MKNTNIFILSFCFLAIASCSESEEANLDLPKICSDGIDELIVAIDGGAGNANQRTEAEGELDEALEARDREQWGSCIDALEESFEALEMDEQADALGEVLEAIGGDHGDDDDD